MYKHSKNRSVASKSVSEESMKVSRRRIGIRNRCELTQIAATVCLCQGVEFENEMFAIMAGGDKKNKRS